MFHQSIVFSLRMPIDAIYLSKNLTVLGKETIKPWRIGKWFSGTKYTLELGTGAAAAVTAGDTIILEY